MIGDGIRRSLRLADEFLRPSRAADRSIPVLDGGLSPNDKLDQFDELWADPTVEPDDIVAVGDRVVFSTGSRVHVLSGRGGAGATITDLGYEIGALAAAAHGRFFAVTIGGPVLEMRIDHDESVRTTRTYDVSTPCPTAAAWTEGTLYIAQGSTEHAPSEWKRDLMLEGSTGSVSALDLESGQWRTLFSGLAWAGGVAVDPISPERIFIAESWKHRVTLGWIGDSRVSQLGSVLPGYPGRLSHSTPDHLLVTILSLRTHLVEFVLREKQYRDEMVRSIDPDFWVAPAIRFTGERWEPLQIGSMKHLNVTKPWAPPRAYGMVAEMSHDGVFLRSWQARVGSSRTGVTGAAALRDAVVVACKGGRSVLSMTLEGGVRG